MTPETIADVLAEAFGADPWPSPLRRFTGDKAHLISLLKKEMRGKQEAETIKTGLILGSLVLGEAAERVFEATFRTKLSTSEIQLLDQRQSRSDTDYKLLNGDGRQLYRINIKFHGTQFRKAREMVGLDPDDCFPLATYKIKSALDKQDQEHLPYLFVIVTGTEISAEAIQRNMPGVFLEAAHLGKKIIRSGKRALEEKIVARFIDSESDRFQEVIDAINEARWYVISARRAEKLMKDNLFDRVFALRMRSFNRAYRNAELDMHFSFSQDMMPLEEFLKTIGKEGHFKVVGMLERGTI